MTSQVAHMSARQALLILVVLAVAALVAALLWPRGVMATRNIGCAQVEPGRGREICQALSDSMEWTWKGHAIIAPGWRITWQGLHRVYCGEKISAADIQALEMLARRPDWRLESGAASLLRL